MTQNQQLGGNSVCLRSKRSEVRILSGVPETNNLGAEQTTPDALPEQAKESGTTANCEQGGKERPIETLARLLGDSGVKMTFSIHCHSGIAKFIGPDHKCGCWRCRQERGEPWSEQTEAEAAEHCKAATRLFRNWALEGGAK